MIPGSWQLVLIVGLLAFIALGSIICGIKPLRRWLASRRRLRRRMAVARPDGAMTPWPLADYEAQRRAKVEWLGARYLLNQPVNRRPS